MKFKIVWIDDSKTWVRSVRADVDELFTDCGFTPLVEHHEKTQPARDSILNGYADLILVDCNLPDDSSGNEFILDLRINRCFAHIVFYSQDENNLQVLETDKHSLHVTHRNDIIDVLGEVADQASRKYKHPAFMRGLLLSEFIDLENLIEDLIVQCFKSEGKYFRETIIFKGGESFSLAAKQKFVSRLIKDAQECNATLRDKLAQINFTSNQFSEKIIKRRNILAHAYPEYDRETGKITLISSIDNVYFTGDWFHETRECIHDHKNKIRALIGLELQKVVNPEGH